MTPVPFRDLPLAVRLSTAASGFMAWVLFAEFVIDRRGWDAWLPLYRVGAFCVYDAAIAFVLMAALLIGSRRR